ncbi:MAG: fused MFS/spermidine synthase, partial [Phycisphaerae bacterium]|nr:fused MFS/spermidine synthase [Phycisphaerae bacterium]
FQGALLAGYLYAHLLGKIPSRLAQLIVHAAVLALAALALPIGLHDQSPPLDSEMPIGWVLGTLALTVGAPFFALASAGPLLQKWFAQTDHPHARDPYFLYAASNLGSMLALLGYPLLLEPAIGLAGQRVQWSIAYGLFAASALACGWWMLRRPVAAATPVRTPAVAPADPSASDETVQAALSTSVTPLVRLRWVFLAFVPSSMMLGATQYIATDIASFPLLWVIPLSIYLLTFIVAFSPRCRWVVRVAQALLPPAVLFLALMLYKEPRFELKLIVIPHLVGLLIVGLVCHGRLAAERPDASRLTEFYLWIAVGGVLGGIFNSIVAPLVFTSVAEYPIALVLACLARPWRISQGVKHAIHEWWVRFNGALDLAVPVAVGALFTAMPAVLVWLGNRMPAVDRFIRQNEHDWGYWALRMGIPAALCLVFARMRLRFALCVAAVCVLPFLDPGKGARVVHADRTFFGVYRVHASSDRNRDMTWHQLYHGRTMHGSQLMMEPWSLEPTTYYSTNSPIRDVFHVFDGRADVRAAFVGMGGGTLAAFGKPGWVCDFYEIDPAMVRIATDPELFTYIRDARAKGVTVNTDAVGDARITLSRAPAGVYDLIILDAFSSDAIPVHLLTREAIEMYLSRLRPGGVLVFHITNGYLDLSPVMARAAETLGLAARVRDHTPRNDAERGLDPSSSQWLVMVRAEHDLGPIEHDDRWEPPLTRPDVPAWTDDYSNLFRVLKWK